MNFFTAKTDRQLGMCLRILYSENITHTDVKISTNSKQKLEYHIYIDADSETFERLQRQYQTMIS